MREAVLVVFGFVLAHGDPALSDYEARRPTRTQKAITTSARRKVRNTFVDKHRDERCEFGRSRRGK